MGIPVVLAIFVGLACSFIQSLGLTIQRKSHVDDAERPPELRKKAIRRPLWIVGFAVYISSNVFGSVFQIGALPIVVLAPLGGISLLWNSLLAHLLLGEGFTSAMMLGTVLIASGAVLIAIFGVVPDGTHSLDEILALWARPAFVAFFSVVCLAVALTLAAAHVAVWRVTRDGDGIKLGLDDESDYASPTAEPAIPFRRTSFGAETALETVPVLNALPASPDTSRPDTKTVRFAYGSFSDVDAEDAEFLGARASADERTLTLAGLAFGAASGTLSGLCLVLAKAAIELVISTIEHWRTGRGSNEFTRPQTWLLVAGLAIAAVLQLVYLNYGLLFASPALICPLAFCFFNLASIFDGLVFYDQLGRLSAHQILLVSVGVAVLLVGVWTVSAIQPTGQGGVEVGTWVEEEVLSEEPLDIEAHDELEAGDGATLLGAGDDSLVVAEPDELESPTVTIGPPRSPRIDTAIAAGATPMSPHSPHSPTLPRRRRPRFGTLVPELAPGGAPTGFAFGIGAASPGFALRSNSISLANGPPSPVLRRSRSRSDAAARAGSVDAVVLPGVPGAPVLPIKRPRPHSMTLPVTAVEAIPTPPIEHPEAVIAEWDNTEPRRQRWRWPSLWGSGGQVKL
ncbi:hypothetical protein Q8F55_002622 [Vanrija albida]|uniref:EamA domain-containing protein n=1 Tax=Vanrija albida TaxID=181172 RepID=A0ABR3QAI5_9TREE